MAPRRVRRVLDEGRHLRGGLRYVSEIPVVLLSSWYDAYVRTTLDNYEGLSRGGKRPLSLIMGPWLHGNRNSTFSGDAAFGEQATIAGNVTPSWLEFRRRWFDRWLKENRTASTASQRSAVPDGRRDGLQDRGGKLDHGGRWIEASRWPLPRDGVPTVLSSC